MYKGNRPLYGPILEATGEKCISAHALALPCLRAHGPEHAVSERCMGRPAARKIKERQCSCLADAIRRVPACDRALRQTHGQAARLSEDVSVKSGPWSCMAIPKATGPGSAGE